MILLLLLLEWFNGKVDWIIQFVRSSVSSLSNENRLVLAETEQLAANDSSEWKRDDWLDWFWYDRERQHKHIKTHTDVHGEGLRSERKKVQNTRKKLMDSSFFHSS